MNFEKKEMMMMKRVMPWGWVLVSVLFLSYGFTGEAEAREVLRSFNSRIPLIKMLKSFSSDLALTSEQQVVLNRISIEIKEKRKANRSEKMRILAGEVQKESIDEEQIRDIFKKRSETREEMLSFVISKFSEFHAQLSPDQRLILSTKIEGFDGWEQQGRVQKRERKEQGGGKGGYRDRGMGRGGKGNGGMGRSW